MDNSPKTENSKCLAAHVQGGGGGPPPATPSRRERRSRLRGLAPAVFVSSHRGWTGSARRGSESRRSGNRGRARRPVPARSRHPSGTLPRSRESPSGGRIPLAGWFSTGNRQKRLKTALTARSGAVGSPVSVFSGWVDAGVPLNRGSICPPLLLDAADPALEAP